MVALQFGPNCEVVVHDLETGDMDHSIVAIENGHVSGRKLGDGPSHIVLESMHEDAAEVHDRAPYLTKTADGKLLKSSTIFIRDDAGNPVGIMGINFDITLMKAFERSLDALTGTGDKGYTEPDPITGAFLISKSSERACEFFGISKYSFYSYLNEAKAEADDK